ncbi:hypothetical protein ACHAQH_010124, partial [Verticillium albo-atrum]
QDPDFCRPFGHRGVVTRPLSRPPQRAALTGLGGIDKSQLVMHYTQDIRTASPDTSIFWVHAGTAQRFEDAYRTIEERRGLPGCRDPEMDVLRLVHGGLYERRIGRWLMVLDNADDVRVFSTKHKDDGEPPRACLLQSDNGSILVISWRRDAAEQRDGVLPPHWT